MFNALRWIVRAGAPWRYLPNDFPHWAAVYQQTRRWLDGGSFAAMVPGISGRFARLLLHRALLAFTQRA